MPDLRKKAVSLLGLAGNPRGTEQPWGGGRGIVVLEVAWAMRDGKPENGALHAGEAEDAVASRPRNSAVCIRC